MTWDLFPLPETEGGGEGRPLSGGYSTAAEDLAGKCGFLCRHEGEETSGLGVAGWARWAREARRAWEAGRVRLRWRRGHDDRRPLSAGDPFSGPPEIASRL